MKRREVIKGLAALPITGGMLQQMLPGSVWSGSEKANKEALSANAAVAGGVASAGEAAAEEVVFHAPSVLYVGGETQKANGQWRADESIFRSLGVEPLINCMGTFTIIGGSLERESVRKAMDAASHAFVQYDELAAGIGQRLAELTGAEWGMVSAGCASCLKQATLACVTGGNPEKLIRVPYLTGLEKTEVVIPRSSRNVYDHAIRNVGVKVIDVDTPEEMEAALNRRTAMIYVLASGSSATGQPLSVENIVRIAKPHNIPVLVDAAAEDLTVPIVHLQRGATLVAYSGGKAFCGPQCSGLLFGRKDLVEAAWYASAPHHGPGRDNKVGREEMIGALAAIEAWKTFDHKAQWATWLSYLDTVSKSVTRVDGVSATVRNPRGLSNNSPVLVIGWDPQKLHITGEELAEEVGRNKPRIALAFGNDRASGQTQIRITAGQMQPGEDKVVADRLYGILSQQRSPKPADMARPAANLSGRWEVTVQFYSSSSPYTWFISQDGNWLQGVHQGELSTWDLVGTVEGDQVKVRGRSHIPGDQVSFTYTGTVSGDTITGSVYMVEYGTAKFTAKRSAATPRHTPITVPGGPPLAT
jgi:seryl-tRNA(Sec) selenium transferase